MRKQGDRKVPIMHLIYRKSKKEIHKTVFLCYSGVRQRYRARIFKYREKQNKGVSMDLPPRSNDSKHF